MEASSTENPNETRVPKVKETSWQRADRGRMIRQATTGLVMVCGIVSLGCMLIKNKNGLTLAENFHRKFAFDERETVEQYLRSIAKDSAKLAHDAVPTPEQIDFWKKLLGNFIGGAAIFMLSAPLSYLGGTVAEKLYLATTDPKKQSQR